MKGIFTFIVLIMFFSNCIGQSIGQMFSPEVNGTNCNSNFVDEEYRSINNDQLTYPFGINCLSNTTSENSSTTANRNDISKKRKQARNCIKIDFFGPIRGYTQITYEHLVNRNSGYELTLGVIGAGINKTLKYFDTITAFQGEKRKQFGLYFSGGYKFGKVKLFNTKELSETHIMQGLYVKPTVYFGRYAENRVAFKGPRKYALERPQTSFAAIQIEFGKEWVISKKAVIDIYWGLGYSVDDKKYYTGSYFISNTTTAFNYSNDRIGRSPGISFTFGIKSGLLFK